MKITPIDIQQAGFGVRFRGYDRQEVDTFLDMLTEDYESLIRDNSGMKEKITDLTQVVRELRKKEEVLNETMVQAQGFAEQTRLNAEKEAELIIKEAELRSEDIVKSARDQVVDIQREILDLEKQRILFVGKVQSLIRTFQDLIEVEAKNKQVLSNERQDELNYSVSSDEETDHPVRILKSKT